MPIIPTYDGPQLRQAGVPDAYQQNQDVSSGTQKLAQGFDAAAAAADKIDLQQSTVAAQDAEVRIRSEWFKADQQLRKEYSGQKITGYQGAVDAWWKDAPKKYGEGLTGRAQMIASRSLIAAQEMAQRTSASYATAEGERVAQSSFTAAKWSVVQGGLAALKDGDPIALLGAAADIRTKNDEWAKLHNLSDDEKQALNVKDLTVLNTNALNQMLSGKDPKAAETYWKSLKKGEEFDTTQIDEMQKRIDAAVVTSDGAAAGRAEFAAQAKGKSLNAEIPMESIDDALVKRFTDKYGAVDEKKLAVARQEAHYLVGLRNGQQKEHKAATTNAFFKNISDGVSPATAIKTAIANGMDYDEAHALQHRLTLEATARDGRDLQAMQRAEMRLRLEGGPTYLQYSNPEVLAGIKDRGEVEAMRAKVGVQQTEQLLQKWDQLQSKEGRATAKMTQETFNAVADKMELHPFAPNKTEAQKAALGNLKAKMDRIADQMAKESPNKPITQEALADRMEKEMAIEVTVNGSVFGSWSADKVPAIQVSEEQLKRTVIPANEKKTIANALKADYARDPSNPKYAPTPENMARAYLSRKQKGLAGDN